MYNNQLEKYTNDQEHSNELINKLSVQEDRNPYNFYRYRANTFSCYSFVLYIFYVIFLGSSKALHIQETL
jgi:hypothetical protein